MINTVTGTDRVDTILIYWILWGA